MKRLIFDENSAISIGLCFILIPMLSEIMYGDFAIGKMFLIIMGLLYIVMGYSQKAKSGN